MKTIKIRDIQDVAAADLEPGMILALGIVIGTHEAEDGAIMADLYGGFVTAWVEPGETWQVYGRLAEDAVEILLEEAEEEE